MQDLELVNEENQTSQNQRRKSSTTTLRSMCVVEKNPKALDGLGEIRYYSFEKG